MGGQHERTGRARHITALATSAAVLAMSVVTFGQASGDVTGLKSLRIVRAAGGDLSVAVAPWGPSEAAVRAKADALLRHRAIQQVLSGHRHRLLAFEILDAPADGAALVPPDSYRATIYDYVRERTVVAEGRLETLRPTSLRIERSQPVPNAEEFQEAVEIVREHRILGPAIDVGRLVPYRPMPPLILTPGVGRTLGVGLRPSQTDNGSRHEIVGVNMTVGTVRRYARGAPPHSLATDDLCGAPDAGQATSARGTAGQSVLTVTRAGQTLWRLVVIRPASSSGTNGSGIELRHVEYLGRRVLERAHAPILNVKYENDTCGPFRDWLWEESMFDAEGDELVSGFSECDRPPRTIGEALTDHGSFRGVAVHVTADEVVLVSELSAGWYRYKSEWRLGADGAIRPRFRFGAVDDSCTCNLHVHNVYWRLDFAVGGQDSDRVATSDTTSPDPRWMEVETESSLQRLPGRTWRVRDDQGHGYEMMPGLLDGLADDFGAGDVWVLQNDPSEIDDGQGYTDSSFARANIDSFLNAEDVVGQDIVLWYGAHVSHGEDADPNFDVGPDLYPVTW